MTVSTITLSEMQQNAVDTISDWYKSKTSNTFLLAGYAGTGKTTLVEYVIEQLNLHPEQVAFACYTGKAALVLGQKLSDQYTATTIHRLIYEPRRDKKSGGVKFARVSKRSLKLKAIRLIVIDEASMLDDKIMDDLERYGIMILYVGDHGQLPPVNSDNSSRIMDMFEKPDFTLTEIHRQAEGNPIIQLSMMARNKQPIPYGTYGENKEVAVIPKSQWNKIKNKLFDTADQIICGYNNTRERINKDARKHFGFSSDYPEEGDKLICTRNNWDTMLEGTSLVNGMTGYVVDVSDKVLKKDKAKVTRDVVNISFRPDYSKSKFENLYIPKDTFEGKAGWLRPSEYKNYHGFDFGYAITCHKSQGSQWNKVVVLSETLNRENHHRWLYTAITRAEEYLILVI